VSESLDDQSSDEAQQRFTSSRPDLHGSDALDDTIDNDDGFPDGASDEPRPRRSSRVVIDTTELAVRRTRNRTYDDTAKGRKGRMARESRQ
jgi:hypothetical protein